MKRERGSVMIEAAVLFSLIIVALVGIVDAGRYLMAYQFVTYAAHEATRYAEVHGALSPKPATAEAVEAYVKRLAMGVDPREIRVETRWIPNNTPGSTVRVKVGVNSIEAASEVVVLQ